MKYTPAIIAIGIIVLIIGGGYWFLYSCTDDWCMIFDWQKINHTYDFATCVARGFPVMESYPRQCNAGTKHFTEIVPIDTEQIKVTAPLPYTVITNLVNIAGEARGAWFFEASFPLVLLDGNGKQIAQSHAEAKGDWMTDDFVPFQGEIHFQMPQTAAGWLVLKKDNPSGLPQYDAEVRVPVRFQNTSTDTTISGVFIRVLRGPMCPVQRIDDPACDNAPYQSTIDIFKAGTVYKTVFTDTDGKMFANLPLGEYTLKVRTPQIFPRCEEKDIKIEMGAAADAIIHCDTGIR